MQSLVDDILLVTERELEWSVGALIEQQRIVAEGLVLRVSPPFYPTRLFFPAKR